MTKWLAVAVCAVSFAWQRQAGGDQIAPDPLLPGTLASGEPVLAYSHDRDDIANRLFQILFVQSIVPEEIQSELPGERRRSGRVGHEYYVPGWYFEKRSGDESDRAWFGGDVRISPRRDVSPQERQELLRLLARLADKDQVTRVASLRTPIAKLLLQWDVLSVWWFWERSKLDDPELLRAMARTVAALSQPADVLRSLDDGWQSLRSITTPSDATTSQPYLPADFDFDDPASTAWVEVGRKSTAIFRADRALRSSRVYLRSGDRDASQKLIESAAQIVTGDVVVPAGTATILVQQMIGIDDAGHAVATGVIDELRVRRMIGPARHDAAGTTSSRDGSSHWIYMRTRRGTLLEDQPFVFVADTDRHLFLEYGTQKHATFAAQCALCHRRTDTRSPDTSGIRIFNRVAKPHLAQPDERLRVAEAEMSVVSDRLRTRLSDQTAGPEGATLTAAAQPIADNDASDESDVRPGGKVKPRAERTAAERAGWIEELRAAYAAEPSAWPAPHVDEGVAWRELGPLDAMPHPADNPPSKAKERLGKWLFHDPRLSGSGQIACASCHDPDLGWADGRSVSFGHGRKVLGRNSPSVRNSGYFESLFWDGRAGSLEDQAIQVMANPDEMRTSDELAIAWLSGNETYRQAFVDVFGDDTISIQRVSQAIACFERTIVGGKSRFDAFIKGRRDRLSDAELIGLDLFRREARCMNCHNGPLMSDGKFHDLGLSNIGRRFEDLGRFNVTGDPQDAGKFRTPSLRNVTQTKPLMHSGLFELSAVLTLYNNAMPTLRPRGDQKDLPHFPKKSPLLKPLGLNQQDLADLTAFLISLEEPWTKTDPPVLP